MSFLNGKGNSDYKGFGVIYNAQLSPQLPNGLERAFEVASLNPRIQMQFNYADVNTPNLNLRRVSTIPKVNSGY